MKIITTWVETTSRESLLQQFATKQWFWQIGRAHV